MGAERPQPRAMRAVLDTLSPEEYVRQIRAALDIKDRAAAEDQFALLLQQSGPSTERWLRRVIVMTPTIRNASAYPVCQDLRQELALYLWTRLADPTRHEMAWETMYWQALIYAQRHVATRYMREAGYWVDARAIAQGRQGVVSLSIGNDRTEELEAPDMLAAAELTGDVQAVVMRLPPKERAALVLRFWRGMREQDIGRALGCTDRTVRMLLQRAQGRMGAWYEGSAWRPPTIE